jgi:GNAT superfamily N-acetyltransferase
MKLTLRPYRDEDDYWRARAFLRDTFLRSARCEWNWQVYRWDYWRRHGLENIHPMPLAEVVFFWETPSGQIAAILNPEARGDAFLQIDPDFRSAALLEEMVDCAENHLGKTTEEGGTALNVWAQETDSLLSGILARRGYAKQNWSEFQRWQMLQNEISAPQLPPGYAIRPVGDGVELIERCYASGLGFHDNDIRYAHDNREVSWYRSIQLAPLYRRDLDLTVVAPDGSVASFCTIWFDDVSRSAAFEPVATVPDQQRKGLGKAVMRFGLRRLVQMGATKAFVGSYSNEAGALYASAAFTQYNLCFPWMRNPGV